jgi:hypothetical protein
MKRLLIVSLLLAFVGIVSVESAYACSGGPPILNIDEMLEQSEIAVVGHFVELDDIQRNGILRVESYLMGEGAAYLAITPNPPRMIEDQIIQQRSIYCSRGVTSPLHTQGQYIFFLSRNTNGTYTWTFSTSGNSYFYAAHPDEILSVVEYADAYTQTYEVRETSFSELPEQIAEQVGQHPRTPNYDLLYPRTMPILLLGETGNYYLLPVDTFVPVPLTVEEVQRQRLNPLECVMPPCYVDSANGLERLLLYASQSQIPTNQYPPYFLIGSRAIISHNGDAVILWRDNELQLYMNWYPRNGYTENVRYGGFMWLSPRLLHSISVQPETLDYPAIWSQDGRTFAFSDMDGLWLWDVYAGERGLRLLVPSSGDTPPVARYFSPQGRYLAVAANSTARYNLDLVSGRAFPDGIISEDDRNLLAFDTSLDTVSDSRIILLATGLEEDNNFQSTVYSVEWIANSYYLIMFCGHGYHQVDAPYVDENYCGVQMRGISQYTSTSQNLLFVSGDVTRIKYEYHQPTNTLLTWINEHTIAINDEEIDLSASLGEPIIKAEWLPSIFYYED